MELEQFPERVTHAVEGLRERAAGAVSSDGGSVLRRIDVAENRLEERIDAVEDTLGGQLAALIRTGSRTSWPRRLFWLLLGAGIGMGIGYLADPDRGRARRAQLSDQAAARARETASEAQKKAKLTVDRARGEVIEGVKEVLPERVPDDPKLLQDRIQSQVFGGRDDVQDVVLKIDAPGTVAVKGTVPSPDSERDLLAKVAEVEGVIDVRSELSVRAT